MIATTPARPVRCPACGSAFRDHQCTAPRALPTCRCGHRESSHFRTRIRVTYCTVWTPPAGPCQCTTYQEFPT